MKKVKFVIMLSIILLFVFSINNIVKAEAGMGTVSMITSGGTISGSDGTAKDVVLEYDSVSLQWSEANPDIGRNRNGYWIGYKIVPPTQDEVSTAYYTTTNDEGVTSEKKSFNDHKDGAPGNYYLEAWVFIDENKLAKYSDTFTLYKAVFDWKNDGTQVQTVTINVNPKKITLNRDESTTSSVKVVDLGNGASASETTFTVKKGTTLNESLTDSEKTIFNKYKNIDGFVRFYIFDQEEDNTGYNFEVNKVDSYKVFDPASTQITKKQVTIVAYINKQPVAPVATPPQEQPAPAPVASAPSGEKDNTPKTGTNDIIKYVVGITLISAMGIIVLNKKH